MQEQGGEKRLVGYVVGNEAQEASEGLRGSTLRERLKRRLSEYSEYMVPAMIVVLEMMPLMAMEK